MRKIILKAIKKLIKLTRLKQSSKKKRKLSEENINLDKILEMVDKEYSISNSSDDKNGFFSETENFKFGSSEKNEDLSDSGELELDAQRGIVRDQVVVINTYLVDKFDNSIKYLVEEFQIEMKSIPESVNGFEYLCHPGLEKEDNLQRYFDNWLKCILKSLYSLMIVVPIYFKYIKPLSSSEKETSSSLNARFKLKIEIKKQYLQKGAKHGQTPKDLEVGFKARHFIGKLLIKMKFSYLNKFEKIWEDVREMQQNLFKDFNRGRRGRFLSEEIQDLDNFQDEKKKKRMGSYLVGTVSPNLSYNFSDLSTSFKKNTRPFRVQESVLGDKILDSLRLSQRSSMESLKRIYRKGKYAHPNRLKESLCIGSDERYEDDFEFVMNEENLEESPPSKRVKKNKSGEGFKVNLTPISHKRRDSKGLAMIGSKLLEIGNILNSDLGFDEDDKMIRFSEELEKFKKFYFRDKTINELYAIKRKAETRASENNESEYKAKIEKSEHKKNQFVYQFDLFEVSHNCMIDSQKSKSLLDYDQFSNFLDRVERDLKRKNNELNMVSEMDV